MFIFVFTDCKCFLYVYQANFSPSKKIKHIISLHTIQNVVSFTYLPLSFSLTYHITYYSSSPTSPAIFMWCSVCYIFIFRVYLTFLKAVTLILKHATLLQTSNSPEAALTIIDLENRGQNIEKSIQQSFPEYASDLSVKQFAAFFMHTEIIL